MKITTSPHRDDYGLTIEIRGHVAHLHPAVLSARVAEAVNEAARVLLIPPDPDVPVPADVEQVHAWDTEHEIEQEAEAIFGRQR